MQNVGQRDASHFAFGIWQYAGAIALVFLATHLTFLPASLEDLDSINFSLGLREFDVARHQPHPPGYPVYIAAGRLVNKAIKAYESRGPHLRHVHLRGVHGQQSQAGAEFLSRIIGRLAVLFAQEGIGPLPIFRHLAHDVWNLRDVCVQNGLHQPGRAFRLLLLLNPIPNRDAGEGGNGVRVGS
jgi:hypothetical protein